MSEENNKRPQENDDAVDLSNFDTGRGTANESEGAQVPDPSVQEAQTSSEIENLQKELEKQKNDYLYLRADFDNYRKSVIKERSDLIKYGSERLLAELLDVLDNFDRALAFEINAENFQSFKEGMMLTRNDLQKTLAKFGVTSVESEGQPFDPTIHEALSTEESDTVQPGHVLREFKKAYKLHDRLLRPAQVVVAKEPSKKE